MRDGSLGITKMIGNAIMRNFSESDTLYMRADTLYAFEKKDSLNTKENQAKSGGTKTENMEKLLAVGRVKVFRNDIQSKCDSLIYDLKDSVIHFFKKPILWSTKNQSEADTIHVFIKNNKVYRMQMINQSFVIAKDTAQNFNQIKGRNIQVLFNSENKMEKVMVDGNGESIYFAMDDKNKLIGVNRVECGKMNVNFKDNQVNKISFLGKPDSSLVPPKEFTNESNRLDGFSWKENEKPSKKDIFGSKFDIK